MRRLFVSLITIMMSTLFSFVTFAEDGGGDTGGAEAAPAPAGDGGDSFDYDDGSGSVTVVDLSTGSQEIARAARAGRAITVRGSQGARSGHRGPVPEYHRVVRGDTLWDLSSRYFGNSWHWPRVWSYNAEVTNPNWIYPGDRIRLLEPGQVVQPTRRMSFHRRGWDQPGTIFMRSRGFVDRETLERSGTVVGSQEEEMMLAEHQEAYVEFPDEDDVRVGEEYTIYRIQDEIPGVAGGRGSLGHFVEIFGAARVISYDEDEQIARAMITESINPIERGYLVGPLRRRFEVIPPVQNEVDLEGYVVGAVDPIVVMGQHYLIFVDRGREDGLLEGNRLFILRQRDLYRYTNDQPDDRPGYPFEVIAELRVIELRDRTAVCLVTHSVTDIHAGDRFEMRQGY